MFRTKKKMRFLTRADAIQEVRWVYIKTTYLLPNTFLLSPRLEKSPNLPNIIVHCPDVFTAFE